MKHRIFFLLVLLGATAGAQTFNIAPPSISTGSVDLQNSLEFLKAVIGNEGGGGGAAVVCRDTNGKITQAMLYDTYAALNDTRTPRQALQSDGPPAQQLELVLQRLKTAMAKEYGYRRNDEAEGTLRRGLGLVERDWTPLEPGTRLPFVPDVEPDFLPAALNCGLESVAHYEDDISTLRVNTEIYDRFSTTDQAALKMHEAIYKFERLFRGATSSKGTRALVAELFTTPVHPEDDQLIDLSVDLTVDLYPTADQARMYERAVFNAQTFDFLLGGKALVCQSPREKVQFEYVHDIRSAIGATLQVTSSNEWYSTLEVELGPTANKDLADRNGNSLGISSADGYQNSYEIEFAQMSSTSFFQGTSVIGRYTFSPERGNYFQENGTCSLK